MHDGDGGFLVSMELGVFRGKCVPRLSAHSICFRLHACVGVLRERRVERADEEARC